MKRPKTVPPRLTSPAPHPHLVTVAEALASPYAPPCASAAVMELSGLKYDMHPYCRSLLLGVILCGGVEGVSMTELQALLIVMAMPGHASIVAERSRRGTVYFANYVDKDGNPISVRLGQNPVIAEWAEGLLEETRWAESPHAKLWNPPQPQDLYG